MNWFGLRCLFRMCPFRPYTLGAYCTLGSCNRRITIDHPEQSQHWMSVTNLDSDSLPPVSSQSYLEELRQCLPIAIKKLSN